MKNTLMQEKELNVKTGDRVVIYGWKGTVTEVYHTIDEKWNGTEYEEIPGSESTSVKVAFDAPEEIGYQYEGGVFGGYTVIR